MTHGTYTGAPNGSRAGTFRAADEAARARLSADEVTRSKGRPMLRGLASGTCAPYAGCSPLPKQEGERLGSYAREEGGTKERD